MSICPNCKTRLAANAKFCPGCGMQIKIEKLEAGEIALIQDELSHCRYNESCASWGLAGGLVFGFFSLAVMHYLLVTILGFGLAVLSLLVGAYYNDKGRKLKAKLKGR